MKLGTNEERLIEALITERATRKKEYDDAYPDEGMSPGYGVFYAEAVQELKAEGFIPATYPK
jgi:hypothetical protein